MPQAKMPQPEISEKQLTANRANAARSTGPRTDTGKSRSAQNARRHGFTASHFAVVRLEDADAVAHLRADLIALYQPANSQELFALERIALLQHTLLRAARIESGLLTSSLREGVNDSGKPYKPLPPALIRDVEVSRAQHDNFILAEGFRDTIRDTNCWGLFLRYQAQAERQYRRAIEEFERLKALRGKLPNEAISEAQPEQTEPSCAPRNEPISTPEPRAASVKPDRPNTAPVAKPVSTPFPTPPTAQSSSSGPLKAPIP